MDKVATLFSDLMNDLAYAMKKSSKLKANKLKNQHSNNLLLNIDILMRIVSNEDESILSCNCLTNRNEEKHFQKSSERMEI